MLSCNQIERTHAIAVEFHEILDLTTNLDKSIEYGPLKLRISVREDAAHTRAESGAGREICTFWG